MLYSVLYSYSRNTKKIKEQVKKLALAMSVKGLMNVQFAIRDNEIYLLEVNPRASRTIPFVSKSIGVPLAQIAVRVMCGQSLLDQKMVDEIIPNYFFVKEVVLPFYKFQGVNPMLGPEMRSTGEVMGIGTNFAEAFSKAMLSASINIKNNGRVLLSIGDRDKNSIINIAKKLIQSGFLLDATIGTHYFLKNNKIDTRLVNKLYENRPNVQDRIKNGEYSYIVYTASCIESIKHSTIIYSEAMQQGVHFDSTINGSFATTMTLNIKDVSRYEVRSLQSIHKEFY